MVGDRKLPILAIGLMLFVGSYEKPRKYNLEIVFLKNVPYFLVYN